MALVAIACPSCNHPGKIPEIHLGKKVRCKKCQAYFVVGAETELPPIPELMTGGHIREDGHSNSDILFSCSSCGDQYAVSVSTRGKLILCRSCFEPSRPADPDDEGQESEPVFENEGGISRSLIAICAVLFFSLIVGSLVVWQFVERGRTPALAVAEQGKQAESQKQVAEIRDQLARIEAERRSLAKEREALEKENIHRQQLEAEEKRKAEQLARETEIKAREDASRKAEEEKRASQQRIEQARQELIQSIKENDKKAQDAILEYVEITKSARVVVALTKIGRLVILHEKGEFNLKSIEASLGPTSLAEVEEMQFLMKKLAPDKIININDPPEKWVSLSKLFDRLLEESAKAKK